MELQKKKILTLCTAATWSNLWTSWARARARAFANTARRERPPEIATRESTAVVAATTSLFTAMR